MFVLRVLTFVVSCILLAISTIASRRENGRVLVGLLWFFTIILIVYSLGELIIVNPNEWLAFKIVGYCITWAVVYYNCQNLESFSFTWFNARVLLPFFSYSLLGLGYTAIVISIKPAVPNRELINSSELVAVKDGYAISGGGQHSLFGGSYTIAENGYYRYYYYADDGGIKQENIAAKDAIIYYLNNGETPHVDVYHETICKYGTYNKKKVPVYLMDDGYCYELYIPKNSLAEAYLLDLE